MNDIEKGKKAVVNDAPPGAHQVNRSVANISVLFGDLHSMSCQFIIMNA